MTPTLFTSLAVAATISLGTATLVHNSGNVWSTNLVSDQKLFPDLEKKLEEMNSFEITHKGQTLTFVKKDGQWTIKEKSYFPVKSERLRSVISQLSQAGLIEPKTSNSERYHLLELGDPARKESKSYQISMLDKNNNPLAEVILGKTRWSAFGEGKSGLYLRKPGEAQSWLSNANISPGLNVKEWVDNNIFNLETEKIKNISFKILKDSEYKVEAEAQNKNKFRLIGFDNNAKLKSEDAANEIAKAFQNIELDDVRKLDKKPKDEDISIANLHTTDGLKIRFNLRREDNKYWLSIEASGEGKAKQDAEKINSRVKGWEYQISNSKAESLFQKKADLIESSTS